MGSKLKKVTGWICLVCFAFLLLGEVLFFFVPSLAEIANRTLIAHLISLGMIFMYGALGFYLVWGKTEFNSFMINFAAVVIFICPVIWIKIALETKPSAIQIVLLSFAHIVLIVISVVTIILPHIFSGRILQYVESKQQEYKKGYLHAFNILGMGCAAVPAAMGFIAVSFGVPTREIYYFAGFSYLAMIIWWIRWHILCLKT